MIDETVLLIEYSVPEYEGIPRYHEILFLSSINNYGYPKGEVLIEGLKPIV